MTPTPARTRRWVRAYRLTRLAVHFGWGLLQAGTVFPRLRPERRARMVERWSRKLLAILRIQLRCHNRPTASLAGHLLVSNHVSWLDVFVTNSVHASVFVAKSEIRAWPLAGWLLARVGTLFIERGSNVDLRRVNQAAARTLQQGACLAVYPEGRTSDGSALHPFRPGLLQVGIDMDAPCMPAALRYLDRHGLPSGATLYIDDMSLWQSLKAIVAEPELHAEIIFSEPIRLQAYDRRSLARHTQQVITRLLAEAGPAQAPGTRGDPPDATR